MVDKEDDKIVSTHKKGRARGLASVRFRMIFPQIAVLGVRTSFS